MAPRPRLSTLVPLFQLTIALLVSLPAECADEQSSPYDVNVRWKGEEGLLITWKAPRSPQFSAHHYIIEFRTVADWAELASGINEENFVFTTPSSGAKYHFRVVAVSQQSLARSEPSEEFIFDTGDPQSPASTQSKIIAAVVATAAIILVFVAIVLAFKFIKQRRMHSSRAT